MDGSLPSRRRVLSVLGAGLTGGFAGCGALSGAEPTPDAASQTENGTTDASADDVGVRVSTVEEPAKLPPVWNDQDVGAFRAQFQVETSGGVETVGLSNGTVQLGPDSDQWQGDRVTVQPGQMQTGEQEFTATATAGTREAHDTTTAVKPIPANYKIDVVPEQNEPLRQRIAERADEEDYLEQRGGFVTSDPVFDTYGSHEQLDFDKLEIDLAAYEWHHDNDFANIQPRFDPDTRDFIDSIGRDTGNSTIEAIKSGEKTPAGFYPNGDPAQYEVGSFEYESFRDATTLGEALAWLFPYHFNWQAVMTEVGPFSAEDSLYAPTLEQAIEQKGHPELEVHAWDVGLGGGHGNGLIYGHNADGSEELRVMETVQGPVTATADERQLFPLVEESGYLTPENDGFSEYYHPLRFGWEDDGPSDTYTFGFAGRKTMAAKVATEIASSTQADSDWTSQYERIAPTTEYMVDFTEQLRTFNANDVPFQKLYDQAKVLHKLSVDEGTNHVVYGTTENPQYAVVDDHTVLDAIWGDAAGEYDDFDRFLEENPGTWRSTCLDDGTVSFEAESDYLTRAQNRNGKQLEFVLENQTDCRATIEPARVAIERQTESGWTTATERNGGGERMIDPGRYHTWYLSLVEYPRGNNDRETHFFVSLDPGTYRLAVAVELDRQTVTKRVRFEIGS